MSACCDLTADGITMPSRPADVDESSGAVIQQLPSFTVQNLLNQSAAKTDRVAIATPSSDMLTVDAVGTPSRRPDVVVDSSGRLLSNIFGSNLTAFDDRRSQHDHSAYGHQSLFYGYVADSGLTAASPAATSAASIDSAFYSPYADAAGGSADGGQSMIASPCDVSGYLSSTPAYKPMAFPSSVPDVDAAVGPLFQTNVSDYVVNQNNSAETALAFLTSSSGYVSGISCSAGNMLTSATGSSSARSSFDGISRRSGQPLLESSASSTFLDNTSSVSVGHGLDDGMVGSYLQTRENLYFTPTACYPTVTTNCREFEAAVVPQRPPEGASDEFGRSGGMFFPVSQSSSLHPGFDGCDQLPVKAETTPPADFNRRRDVGVASAAAKKSPLWVLADPVRGTGSLQSQSGTHPSDNGDAAIDDVSEISDVAESKGMSENRSVC